MFPGGEAAPMWQHITKMLEDAVHHANPDLRAARWKALISGGWLVKGIEELLKDGSVAVDVKGLEEVSEKCWELLIRKQALVTQDSSPALSPPDSESDSESDQVDIQRLYDRACSQFAAGMAAFW